MGKNRKKVLIFTGTPEKQGATALLAEEFGKGAEFMSHLVYFYRAAFMDEKAPSEDAETAENAVKKMNAQDLEHLRLDVQTSDIIVLATPTYYMTDSAQLSDITEAFRALGDSVKGKTKAFILATWKSKDPAIINTVRKNFADLCEEMDWENSGELFAQGYTTAEEMKKAGYAKQAYALGMGVDFDI